MSEIPQDIDESEITYFDTGKDRDIALKMINQAVLAERSACAKIAYGFVRSDYDDEFDRGFFASAQRIAAAIRRR